MSESAKPVRVLVVGAGNMGRSHATAYHTEEGFEIVGIVARGKSKVVSHEQLGGGYALYDDYTQALEETKPDAVCISTYPDTHEAYAIQAMEAGAHVFVEKPIADSVAAASRVVAAAKRLNMKVVIGYILHMGRAHV